MMDNKVVLISGGLGDIGSAIALEFGRQGKKVAICDLVKPDLITAKLEALRTKGCKDLFYQEVDVTSENAVATWIEAVEKKWGTPQIIVPNAGMVVQGALTGSDLQTEQVRKQLDVNFWGAYYLAVNSAKLLIMRGLPGRIVFIGSWAAERPNSRISAYCISKSALRMLCKTLALELADADILVNEIAPGIVAGGLSKKNQQNDAELLKKHLASIPVKQLVTVEEVAKHVSNLADFALKNITGTILEVDGGLSLTSKMS